MLVDQIGNHPGISKPPITGLMLSADVSECGTWFQYAHSAYRADDDSALDDLINK